MSIRVATRLHRFLCGVRLFCGLRRKPTQTSLAIGVL
jgi:hypothetical protein